MCAPFVEDSSYLYKILPLSIVKAYLQTGGTLGHYLTFGCNMLTSVLMQCVESKAESD